MKEEGSEGGGSGSESESVNSSRSNHSKVIHKEKRACTRIRKKKE